MTVRGVKVGVFLTVLFKMFCSSNKSLKSKQSLKSLYNYFNAKTSHPETILFVERKKYAH